MRWWMIRQTSHLPSKKPGRKGGKKRKGSITILQTCLKIWGRQIPARLGLVKVHWTTSASQWPTHAQSTICCSYYIWCCRNIRMCWGRWKMHPLMNGFKRCCRYTESSWEGGGARGKSLGSWTCSNSTTQMSGTVLEQNIILLYLAWAPYNWWGRLLHVPNSTAHFQDFTRITQSLKLCGYIFKYLKL